MEAPAKLFTTPALSVPPGPMLTVSLLFNVVRPVKLPPVTFKWPLLLNKLLATKLPVTLKLPKVLLIGPSITPDAFTVPRLVRPPLVASSVPVVVSAPELVKPADVVVQVPELVTMLALLASPFHVPPLLTVAPPVLLRRFPFQVALALLVISAAAPVLLTSALKVPLLVTVPELSNVPPALTVTVPALVMTSPALVARLVAANDSPLPIVVVVCAHAGSTARLASPPASTVLTVRHNQ